MALIADILLIAGALGAAFYCIVLSRRLSKLTNLETGMGGAISVLSAQVTEMTETLDRAQAAAHTSSDALKEVTLRAESAAQRLELMLASLHDLPDAAPEPAARPAPEPDPATRPAPGSEAPAAATPPKPAFAFMHRPRRRFGEAAE